VVTKCPTNGNEPINFDLITKKVQAYSGDKPVFFTVGYVASLPQGLSATSNFSYTAFSLTTQYEDTITSSNNVKGKIQMPLMHGLGFTFRKGNSLTLTAQAEMQLWSNFKFFDEQNTFKNSKKFAVGLQYVPNKLATGSGTYFKKVHYRLGGRYTDGNLELNNSRISEMAVSIGFGLPVGKVVDKSLKKYGTPNIVNLSVEAGQMGTTSNNLVQQKFIRAVLGISINDIWFKKTVYD
jgi:hypothetical protein